MKDKEEEGIFIFPPTDLGQKTMVNSNPVVIASDQSIIPVLLPFSNRSDTFTAIGNGVTIDVSTKPVNSFSIEVKGTGGAATVWNVVLEGSLNNSDFTTILTHTSATGDGVILFSGSALSPVLFFRSRVVSLTLGVATNIVVTILGMK